MLVVLVVLVEVNLLVDQGVDMRQVQRADLKLVDRQILVAVVLEGIQVQDQEVQE
jgi:hypothetical protein